MLKFNVTRSRLASSLGMVPVISLSYKESRVNSVKFEYSEGMLPVKALLPNDRLSKAVILPNCVGTGPVRRLSFIQKCVIAVSNPIYVDVDGNGFQPNGDDLGLELPEIEELR